MSSSLIFSLLPYFKSEFSFSGFLGCAFPFSVFLLTFLPPLSFDFLLLLPLIFSSNVKSFLFSLIALVLAWFFVNVVDLGLCSPLALFEFFAFVLDLGLYPADWSVICLPNKLHLWSASSWTRKLIILDFDYGTFTAAGRVFDNSELILKRLYLPSCPLLFNISSFFWISCISCSFNCLTLSIRDSVCSFYFSLFSRA